MYLLVDNSTKICYNVINRYYERKTNHVETQSKGDYKMV